MILGRLGLQQASHAGASVGLVLRLRLMLMLMLMPSVCSCRTPDFFFFVVNKKRP